MNILFYQGKTQYSNTGDALINKSLVEHFRPYANILINDKGMPSSYLKELNLKQTELSGEGGIGFISLLIRTAFINLSRKKTRIYYLATPPGHQFGGGAKNFIKHCLLLVLYLLLSLLRVKIIKIGFSIGPIDKGAEFLERCKSCFVPYYFVRDPLSLALVHRIGIKHASLFPDLAWTYNANPTEVPTDAIFISFRNQVVTGMDGSRYASELVHKICDIVISSFSRYKIVIGYQVQEDREFCRSLYNVIKSHRDVEFDDTQILLESAERFSKYSVVLTNRLHVALLGYQYGALPIILSDINKHQKIKGIFEHAEASSLLLDVNTSQTILTNSVNNLVANLATHLRNLESKELQYADLSKKVVRHIFH
ncbi:polysaccharide pyruvyl transferase family protein [Sphingobacterium griseoflavum]|uniref:Polysaccharide pyruvyl transferase domain-containing protein n=1 Tax=Sphingobacterium griseoflavum TaxID=1474952 RepID=A0ABQ3I0N9_9SPHI|nr:polysaccharide pyruvyl transferase family protein [Sphingobacterium griseoflavum]GHE39081.1 hypothetical protein GCM10017764_22850 [Sphingobacterium griseoflavum]